MLYGLICRLGVEGGVVLGLTLAELISFCWNHRNCPSHGGSCSPSQKVYFFNRRLHHGQIGALLLPSLFLRRTSVPAAILTGIGIGLVRDDYADFKEWFRFKKGDENKDRKIFKSENDPYSGNQEFAERHLYDKSINNIKKPPLFLVCKKMVAEIEAQFDSVSNIVLQSRKLRRQRRHAYYRFKRWENSVHR